MLWNGIHIDIHIINKENVFNETISEQTVARIFDLKPDYIKVFFILQKQ